MIKTNPDYNNTILTIRNHSDIIDSGIIDSEIIDSDTIDSEIIEKNVIILEKEILDLKSEIERLKDLTDYNKGELLNVKKCKICKKCNII